jgi:hypothetical protein
MALLPAFCFITWLAWFFLAAAREAGLCAPCRAAQRPGARRALGMGRADTLERAAPRLAARAAAEGAGGRDDGGGAGE